MKKEEEV